MKKFGLIGYPLSHSFSLKYFQEKFKKEHIHDVTYELFPIENISFFKQLIESTPYLCGLNVTIPYKEKILPFLQAIDEQAKEIGAVNCIKIIKNKQNNLLLKGYNTDAVGFEYSINPLLKSYHRNALIIGNGGGAKAISFVLKKNKIDYLIVSRTPTKKNHIAYNDLTEDIISNSTLIVNTTPLGMFPYVNTFPNIPYQYLTSKHLLYDLVYNPIDTLFLKKGNIYGAQTKNGLSMLHLQAEESWKIWNNDA